MCNNVLPKMPNVYVWSVLCTSLVQFEHELS